MIEDLAKTTPILYVPGNHDINFYTGDAIAYFKRHGKKKKTGRLPRFDDVVQLTVDLPYAHPDKAKDGMNKTDGMWHAKSSSAGF
jgi:hypothetical protein